jgi:hypothetical protein
MAFAAQVLGAGCAPAERVVARVEKLSDGGTPTLSPEAGEEPQLPDRQEPETTPPLAGTAGAAGMAGSPSEPPPAAPPSVTDSSCRGLTDAWDILYDAVHENDCRTPVNRPGGLTFEEMWVFFLAIQEAFSTPVNPAAAAERRMVMGCDFSDIDIPGYLTFDTSTSSVMFVLCPDTCIAAEQWVNDKQDEVAACARSGDNP